jgi:peptidylprolyl isomerase
MKSLAIAASLLLLATAATAAVVGRSAPPAAAAAPSAADFRAVDPENTLVIDTTRGRVIVELFPEAAPSHVERVKALARANFYDGLSFFRVIDDFMAQTGDPRNTGMGGSDKPDLPGEFIFRRGKELPLTTFLNEGDVQLGFIRSLPVFTESDAAMAAAADGKVRGAGLFCAGVAGAARTGDPNSANSQFFLMRQPNMSLNAQYTAFGRVVSGLDVVRAITVGEPPENPDRMTQVRVLADLPQDKRPQVRVMDTAGPAFKAMVDRAKAVPGRAFSLCDLDIPVQVTDPR